MPWYLSVLYSATAVSAIILIIFWLVPRIIKIKTMETFYPFDTVYLALSKRITAIPALIVVAGLVLVGMLSFAGAGIPIFMLGLYLILALAVTLDFGFDRGFRGVIPTIVFAIAFLGWYFRPTWLTYNLAIIAAGSYILTIVSVKNARTYILLSLVMMIYDVIAVYGAGAGATTINSVFIPPVLVVVPKEPLNLDMVLSNVRAVLGITDVLVAGVAFKYAKEQWGGGNIVKVFVVASILIVFGLSKLTGIVQPALLIIVPMCWLALALEKRLATKK